MRHTGDSSGKEKEAVPLRAVIFANGELNDLEAARALLRPDDLLIAADGGLRHCRALGLAPAVVIGDFDSLGEAELGAVREAGAELLRHPARKDETDLELALLHARAEGAREIVVLGGLGARWDQTLANLLLTAHRELRGLNISFADGNQRIYPVNGEARIAGRPGDIVSLIPIGGDARGVTTRGLEYPLDDGTLAFGATRGVSNALLEEEATVSVREGLLLCVVIHHPG